MAKNKTRLHQRLDFDLENGQVFDGPRRYLIMRPDVLMGAFDQLEPDIRLKALEALGYSVTRHGGQSVQSYLEEVGVDSLLATMVENSASLGWGRWSFVQHDDQLSLEVRNSPFAYGSQQSEKPVCHAISGMLRAVAEAIYSRPCKATEIRCACQEKTSDLMCFFKVQKN